MRKILYFLLLTTQSTLALELCDTELYNEYFDQFEYFEITPTHLPNTNIETLITRFNQLPNHLFPILPEGFMWDREDNDNNNNKPIIPVIWQHQDAPDTKFELRLFEDAQRLNQSKKCNYLWEIDGVHYQGVCHTRNPSLPRENVWALTTDDFIQESTGLKFMRGHVLDYADDPSNGEVWAKTNPYNLIPEPPNSIWGTNHRRIVAGKLREQLSGYVQWAYYPEKTQSINCGIYIPQGVIFGELNSSDTLSKIYHTPWAHDIHTDEEVELEELACNIGSQPTPVFLNSNSIEIQKRVNQAAKTDDLFTAYNLLHQAAETEYLTPTAKIKLLLSYHDMFDSSEVEPLIIRKHGFEEYWCRRASEQATFLDENYPGMIDPQTYKMYKKFARYLREKGWKEQEDLWKSLIRNHEESVQDGLGFCISSPSVETLLTSKNFIKPAPKFVEVKFQTKLTSPNGSIFSITHQLNKHPGSPILLRGLTKLRANRIADNNNATVALTSTLGIGFTTNSPNKKDLISLLQKYNTNVIYVNNDAEFEQHIQTWQLKKNAADAQKIDKVLQENLDGIVALKLDFEDEDEDTKLKDKLDRKAEQ